MIGLIVGFGIGFLIVLASLLVSFVIFIRRKSHNVRCIIIYDDGSTKKKDFDRAPQSFLVDKKRYIYDERASIRMSGLKHLFYKANVPEPITVFNVKNPRILTSTEYDAIIRSQVHAELFGASEISLIKTLVIITLVVASIGAVMAMLSLFGSTPPTELGLADTNQTRFIIEESVRRAIGR